MAAITPQVRAMQERIEKGEQTVFMLANSSNPYTRELHNYLPRIVKIANVKLTQISPYITWTGCLLFTAGAVRTLNPQLCLGALISFYAAVETTQDARAQEIAKSCFILDIPFRPDLRKEEVDRAWQEKKAITDPAKALDEFQRKLLTEMSQKIDKAKSELYFRFKW